MPPLWADRLWDILLSPALWLGLTLALTYGALFTLWRGGGWRQLPRDLLASYAGFGLGQLGGVLWGNDLLRIGEIHVLWSALGAAAALLLRRRYSK